jgi:anti-sigma factor RsiW
MRENTRFQCGDGAALVTYLYDESPTAEREQIDAHLATCEACRDELTSLRSTRTQLGTWVPPAADLGFRITSGHQTPPGAPLSDAEVPGRVLRPARWWSRPLPAWAQAAAAAVIFASGLAVGGSRTPSATVSSAPPISAPPAAPAASAAAPAAVVETVSRQELKALESRLMTEMAHARSASSPAFIGDDQVMQQIRELIAESEQRQDRANALRLAQVTAQIEQQRRVDLVQLERTVGDIQRMAGVAFQDQNRLIRYLQTSPPR